jgi:hypothetical protein
VKVTIDTKNGIAIVSSDEKPTKEFKFSKTYSKRASTKKIGDFYYQLYVYGTYPDEQKINIVAKYNHNVKYMLPCGITFIVKLEDVGFGKMSKVVYLGDNTKIKNNPTFKFWCPKKINIRTFIKQLISTYQFINI